MTYDMNISFITQAELDKYDVKVNDSKIVQIAYGGKLKWAPWYIDCNAFSIDNIAALTDKSEK